MTTLAFNTALRIEVASLQAAHPRLADAIGRAHALLVDGQVFPHEDGESATVGSSTDPAMAYHVNGHCACAASQWHTEPCKHRIAYRLYQRIADRLDAEEERWTIDREPEPDAPATGIDPRFIVEVHGKPFITYQGLLTMAHAKGLVELKAEWTYNDAEVSLAHAVAIFADGKRFEESGDSSKENVGKNVVLHWRRMSLVRAKARCLRDALALTLVAREEMGDD